MLLNGRFATIVGMEKTAGKYYGIIILATVEGLIIGLLIPHFFGWGAQPKVRERIAQLNPSSAIPSALPATNNNPFFKFTATTWTGDLGGNAGASQKCAQEFPGYTFCSWENISQAGGNLPDPITYANPFLGGWVDSQQKTGTCDAWQSQKETDKGGKLFANGSTASRWWVHQPGYQECNRPQPICCMAEYTP